MSGDDDLSDHRNQLSREQELARASRFRRWLWVGRHRR